MMYEQRPGSAILITYDRSDALDEAIALSSAAGYEIKYTIQQRYLSRPKYGISPEMIRRLEDVAERLEPDVIIYDEALKPSQNYNLASRLHRNVLDREALILEIFERRASSAESRLQVKMAQMRYEAGRAKEKVRLAKMGEQPGFMGIGRFEVDTYYNDIRHRMNSVRAKLAKAGRQRMLHRQGRLRGGFKTISLAGYTSAGKTTLFNAMTGEESQISKELFTTLTTTTRRLHGCVCPCLISDTVGFISKLPAYMIEAFRSTLEDMIHADATVVMLDISDTPTDIHRKYKSCMFTLSQVGVERSKLIFALNKADRVTAHELNERIQILNINRNRAVAVSALYNRGIRTLQRLIDDTIMPGGTSY